MSGVCGAVGLSPAQFDDDLFVPVAGRLHHRGPDGFSSFRDRNAGVALDHLHLGAFGDGAGDVAFANVADAVVAVAGGILNRDDVLDGRRPLPTATRDAQAALAAYRDHGGDLLEHLDGPFTLALWDKLNRRLILSRDRLGEKCLYYAFDADQNRLVFASEIKAILAARGVAAGLDLDSLSIYLVFGYIPGPRTLFRGVSKLLPGEMLEWDSSGLRSRRYWRLPRITDGIDDEAYCVRRLRELFMEGLARYVGGAREVGVFLSGGMDSSIIVAGLRELGVPRIDTFTVGFAVDSTNPQDHEDLGYARLVADRFATTHHEEVIRAGHDPVPRQLRLLRHYDDLVMTPNAYSKALLAEAVRDTGLNSLLTGSAAAGACGVHRKFLDAKKRERLLAQTRACATDAERFYLLRGRLFDLDTQEKLLCRPPAVGEPEILDTLQHYLDAIQSDDFFRLFLFANLSITSAEKSLKVLDESTNLSSVDVRSPYLDRRLVEFSTQLPSTFDGRSYVSLKTHLKKAFETSLPAEVCERRVIGYPCYYWHRGELAALQRRVLDRETIERNGIFDYTTVCRILEDEKTSEAKSVGKYGWALTEFCAWYEIHINRNPEFMETPGPAPAGSR